MDEGPSVLIIDTEETVVERCEQVLQDTYSVFRLDTDGNTDVSVDMGDIDVVLLGRAIRVISNEDIFEAIRARRANCRVILMTESDSEVDELETVFDGQVTKPLDETELRETIGRLLDRASLDDILRQYYLLAMREATIRPEPSEVTDAFSDERSELDERMEACRRLADEKMGDLVSDSEFVGAIREIMDYSRNTPSPGATG